jgi:Uma2 family endonuclease
MCVTIVWGECSAPKQQKVHVYRSDQEAEIVTAGQALVLPEVFGEFSVPISEFFE